MEMSENPPAKMRDVGRCCVNLTIFPPSRAILICSGLTANRQSSTADTTNLAVDCRKTNSNQSHFWAANGNISAAPFAWIRRTARNGGSHRFVIDSTSRHQVGLHVRKWSSSSDVHESDLHVGTSVEMSFAFSNFIINIILI